MKQPPIQSSPRCEDKESLRRNDGEVSVQRLEADDLRREQKIKKLFKETAKLETDDLRREQMRFLQEESQLPLRGFLLFI